MNLLCVLACGALTLTIRPASPEVMVGEPVKLMVTWRASSSVPRVDLETTEFERGTLRFLIGAGGTEREYRELPHVVVDRVRILGAMPEGTVVRRNLTLTVGESLGSVGVPFPAPGDYRLLARYLPPEGCGAAVDSQPVTIRVAPLDADGLAIRTALAANPRMLLEAQAELRQLVERFPHHRILQAARFLFLKTDFDAVAMGTEPSTGEPLAADAAARRREIDRRLLAIGRQIRADDSWASFEEEALVLGLSAARGRDSALFAQLRQRLLERWPSSLAVLEGAAEP